MSSSKESLEVDSIQASDAETQLTSTQPSESMQEYYQLQQGLLWYTLLLSGIIFGFVWFFYSLHIALNYLIGACTGVVYLRMLAKSVAQLGRQKQRLGSGRLALFIGLMVIATQLNQLEIVPIFLGFLTYKGSLLGYTVWAALTSE
ncbi:ATP synthase subunit I [Almyronema epifaneia]|uniref:ATP synthase subunit I n=1 Tax=Almyronema epifaneia S1 TaxID=2991925 RepID=A0ABW6IBV0_9CYAN